MKAKHFMSLEELAEDTPAPSTDPELTEARIDADSAELRAEAEGLDSASDQIEETSSIADVVQATIDTVEADVARDQPLTEGGVRQIEAVMEHFRARTGYKGELIPSMESFKSGDSMAQTKKVRENLKSLHGSLRSGVSVTQEGIFDRISNAIERAFTSNDKIIRTLPAAIKDLKSYGPKTDVIKDVAWARIFRTRGTVVNSADAHALVKEMQAFHRDSVVLMHKFEGILKEAQRALSGSRFIARDEEVRKIQDLTTQAVALLAECRQATNRYVKGRVDVHPLNTHDAESLSHDVIGLIEDREYVRAVENFEEAIDQANFRAWQETETRMMGHQAADIRAYVSLIETGLRPVYWTLAEVGMTEHLITYGVYKWISASINK